MAASRRYVAQVKYLRIIGIAIILLEKEKYVEFQDVATVVG